MRLIAAPFIDKISGSSFNFVINSGNIMSDNTKANHEYTADNQLQENNGCEAFQCCAGKVAVQGMGGKYKRENQHNPSHKGYKLHG